MQFNPGTDPVIADQLRRVSLTIHDDRTALLEDKSVPWDGLMSRDGSQLNFEVLAISGINIAKQPTDVPRTLRFKILGSGALEYEGTTLSPVKLD